ncbi:glycosyltransferase family 1 protein [Mycobacterium sp. AMU20-3851]|uniref:glycosyltransferase family 4 protein n=1 Tax=Mycobacterium sp. AMU20-3851 TaxID=3122055 RepID=UPI003753FB91
MYLALAILFSRLLLWQRPDRDRPARGCVHINGAWLACGPRDESRYAAAMVKAIAAMDIWDLVVHVPAGVIRPLPQWLDCPRIEVRPARVAGSLFEQVHLPLVTAGQVLLTFAGTAPLLKRRQLVTMHEAVLFRRPAGFPRTKVLLRYLACWWLGRTADGLATTSLFAAHELSDVLRIDVDRFIVTQGADTLTGVNPTRPPLAWTGAEFLVFGSSAPNMNVLSTARALTDSGRRAVVVGLAAKGRKRGTVNSSGDCVVAPQPLTDADLAWLYRHARAAIVPSAYETLGLAPLEAQALGCPVLCSDVAALPEVCRDGALYFDPDDPETLTAQLDRLDREPDLSDELQRRASANSLRYSWNESASKVVRWCRRSRSSPGVLVY